MDQSGIYALVGLGGIIICRATMKATRVAVCNKNLPKNMAWEPVGVPVAQKTNAAQKAWETRRARAEQATA